MNKFNDQVVVPELRNCGKTVQVIKYPGEPHCFCFYGAGPRTPRPATARTAFQDIERFCRQHVVVSPKPIDARFVDSVPVATA
jgi:dienelactone hydrolase